MRNLLLLAPLLLAACGADVEGACQSYFDAANDSTCDAYAGVTDQESADLLNCYADAYTAADCSTSEGWTAAGTDMSACVGG
jgi:hypothetical protein